MEQKHVEALLFAAAKPLEKEELCQLLDCSMEQLESVLRTYKDWLQLVDSGLRLRELGTKVELITAPACAPFVQKIKEKEKTLSAPALETLSVIALKGPVTRAEIEEIRGVNCDGIVRNLLNDELIYQVGQKDTIGKPMLYSVTEMFLHSIGYGSEEELKAAFKEIEGEDHELPQSY